MCTVFILLQYFGAHIAHLIKIRKSSYYAGIMLLLTYYARNYAGIIGASLLLIIRFSKHMSYYAHHYDGKVKG